MKLSYKLASLFSDKSKKNARKKELLSLMLFQPDLRPEDLFEIKSPVLVIAGTRDVIKSSHTKLIASSIPNSHLVIICGDHYIARKNREKFNSAVDEFLSV